MAARNNPGTCYLLSHLRFQVGLGVGIHQYLDNSMIYHRDECLNSHWFISMEDAKTIIERWRVDYNERRPHSSLGQLTPADFAGRSTFFDRISLIAVA
jgi:transposase InsO family protein